MTSVDAYGVLDWTLIIVSLMKKAGISEVEITLEDLNKIIDGDDILKLEEDPQRSLLSLAIISRQQAEALRFQGAEVYGSLKKPTNH